jgi:hypothetical protein
MVGVAGKLSRAPPLRTYIPRATSEDTCTAFHFVENSQIPVNFWVSESAIEAFLTMSSYAATVRSPVRAKSASDRKSLLQVAGLTSLVE